MEHFPSRSCYSEKEHSFHGRPLGGEGDDGDRWPRDTLRVSRPALDKFTTFDILFALVVAENDSESLIGCVTPPTFRRLFLFCC